MNFSLTIQKVLISLFVLVSYSSIGRRQIFQLLFNKQKLVWEYSRCNKDRCSMARLIHKLLMSLLLFVAETTYFRERLFYLIYTSSRLKLSKHKSLKCPFSLVIHTSKKRQRFCSLAITKLSEFYSILNVIFKVAVLCF